MSGSLDDWARWSHSAALARYSSAVVATRLLVLLGNTPGNLAVLQVDHIESLIAKEESVTPVAAEGQQLPVKAGRPFPLDVKTLPGRQVEKEDRIAFARPNRQHAIVGAQEHFEPHAASSPRGVVSATPLAIESPHWLMALCLNALPTRAQGLFRHVGLLA